MIVMTERVVRKKASDLEEILDSARDSADEVDDVRLKAGALAVIASVSGLPKDLEKAIDFAFTTDRTYMKAELLAVIAKTLAEGGDYSRARETALKIEKIDAFWCVEALIHVGRISRTKSDFARAKEVATSIRDSNLLSEALLDINASISETASPSRNGHYHHGDPHVQAEALTDIVRTLAELKSFKEAHMVASKISSAYWRARAFSAIALGLAEAIK